MSNEKSILCALNPSVGGSLVFDKGAPTNTRRRDDRGLSQVPVGGTVLVDRRPSMLGGDPNQYTIRRANIPTYGLRVMSSTNPSHHQNKFTFEVNSSSAEPRGVGSSWHRSGHVAGSA
jgi:hypothetical protein